MTPLPKCCPLGGSCKLQGGVVQSRLSQKPYAFIALPYGESFDDTESTIRIVLSGGKLFEQSYKPKKLHGKRVKPILAKDTHFIGEGTCKICQLCWFAEFGIAELGGLNPNVMVEIGLLWGFGKRVIFTLNMNHTVIKQVPFDIGNQMIIPYYSVRRLGPMLDDKVKFLLLTASKR